MIYLMFSLHLRRMCIMLFWSERFHKHQSGHVLFRSSLPLMIFFLFILSGIRRGILKSQIISVDLSVSPFNSLIILILLFFWSKRFPSLRDLSIPSMTVANSEIGLRHGQSWKKKVKRKKKKKHGIFPQSHMELPSPPSFILLNQIEKTCLTSFFSFLLCCSRIWISFEFRLGVWGHKKQ